MTATARRLWTHALLGLAVLACAALAVFPPQRYGFYPTCPVRAFLHIECPGCGATRAIAALLHGNLREALSDNALCVLLLPWGMVLGFEAYRRAVGHGEFRWPRLPAGLGYGVLAAAASFMVARNLVGVAF